MKKLRFKDSKGKVYEFKNVLLSTGCNDINDIEIFEGDIVEQIRSTHMYSKKAKDVIVKSKVVLLKNNPKRKTICDKQIPQPIQFVTKQICKTKWGFFSWNEFYRCKIVDVQLEETNRIAEGE